MILVLAVVLIGALVGPAFAQGPVAAYGLNAGAGTAAADDSGNGRAGAISGATWSTGKYSGGLSFNGSSSFVTVADHPSLALGRTGTLEAWVSLSRLGQWHGLIAKGSVNNDSIHNYALEVDQLNRPLCIIGDGSASLALSGLPALTANRLTHLACTWDGSMLSLYVDGVLRAARVQTITPASNTAPLYLGQFGGNSDRLAGVLDEVRVYTRALTAAEIQADMAAPVVAGPPPPLPGKGVASIARVDVASWTVEWRDMAIGNGYVFELERGPGVGGPFTLLAVINEGTTRYEDRAVTVGQLYCYRIRERGSAFSNVACTP